MLAIVPSALYLLSRLLSTTTPRHVSPFVMSTVSLTKVKHLATPAACQCSYALSHCAMPCYPLKGNTAFHLLGLELAPLEITGWTTLLPRRLL